MGIMKKPSVKRGPADTYAMRGERIVEISDNNGKGLGALLSVAYDDTPPKLFVDIARLDEGVTVRVEGHVVVPNSDVAVPGGEVHLVMRDNLDGLYGFVDEDQADAYAALFEGAQRLTLRVLDERAGSKLLAQESDEEGE